MESSAEIEKGLMEAQQSAMKLAISSIFPMVLKSVIELDILEIIAKAGSDAYLSPTEIAAQLPTQNLDAPVMLDRMLRLLASHSVLKFSTRHLRDGKVELLYGLTPIAGCFTKNEDGVSVAPLALVVQDKVYMESWYYLKDAVLEGGIPFNKAYGVNVFEYHGKNPRFSQLFNKAMSDPATIIMSEILKNYKGFEGLNSLVDVGGGTGAGIRMITSKYPNMRVVNFDLPFVIAEAPAYPGVEHVAGDMFVSVPKADAIFVKFILHDWGDDYCAKLLKNCYDALPSEGKVIVADFVLPDTPEPAGSNQTVLSCDVLMMALNPNGKERTEKEFETLAKQAGFQEFRLTSCSALYLRLMEFLKKA